MPPTRPNRTPGPARIADAESRVVRWVWATGPLHEPLPYWPHRLGLPLGRARTGPPKRLAGAYSYGFDAADRLVIARHHAHLPGQADVRLLDWTDDAVAIAHIAQGERRVGFTGRLRLEGGRPVSYEASGPGWSVSETYHHDSDRLVRIEVAPNPPEPARTYTLTWDRRRVVRVDLLGRNGAGTPVWEVPRRGGPPLKALVREVERRLVEAVPRAVAAASVDEPVCFLGLVFDTEGSVLPPELMLGLARDRDRWLATHGRDARAYLWSPEDHPGFDDGSLVLDDKPLLAACRALMKRVQGRRTEGLALAGLARACAALNARSWADVVPVTDDFVVVPVRLQGGVRRAHARVAVPPDRLTSWRRLGLL